MAMVSVRTVGSAAVVRMAGAVDVTDVVTLRNEIARMTVGDEVVVVDVSDAWHLGPRGLAALVDERVVLSRRGGELRLVLADHAGPRSAEAATLGRLFHLYATVEEALAA